MIAILYLRDNRGFNEEILREPEDSLEIENIKRFRQNLFINTRKRSMSENLYYKHPRADEPLKSGLAAFFIFPCKDEILPYPERRHFMFLPGDLEVTVRDESHVETRLM